MLIAPQQLVEGKLFANVLQDMGDACSLGRSDTAIVLGAAKAIRGLLEIIETGGAVTPRPTPSAPASEGLRQLRAWHAARRDAEREDSLAQLHDRAVKALNVYFGPEEQL